MCGLIEGIADQVRFLSAAEPSPRLTPVFSSLQKKERKKKDSTGCESHPGEIFNKYFSLPSHAHAHHYLCYTKRARENATNMQMQKAAGVNRSALPPELNERREHKTHIPWTSVLQPSQEWRKTCKLD